MSGYEKLWAIFWCALLGFGASWAPVTIAPWVYGGTSLAIAAIALSRSDRKS